MKQILNFIKINENVIHINNAIAQLLSKLLISAAYFISIPVYVRVHGQASYGVVAFFGVIIGYSVLLENSLSYALMLRYTRALALKKYIDAQKIIRSTMPLYILLMVLCCVGIYFGANDISNILWGKQEYKANLELAGIVIGILIIDAFFVSIIQAHNSLVILNIIRFISDICRVSALYFASFSKDPVEIVLWILLFSAVLKLLLDGWYCLYYLVPVSILNPLIDIKEIKASLRLSPMTFIISMICLVSSIYDKSFVSNHVSNYEFAYYAFASDITVKAQVIFYAVLGTTYNAMIRNNVLGKSVQVLFTANIVAIVMIVLFYYLPLGVFGQNVIEVFMGTDFAYKVISLIRILSFCSVSYMIFSCLEAIHKARGRAGVLAVIYCIGLIVMLISVPYFFKIFGVKGVCYAIFMMFSSMILMSLAALIFP